MCENAGLTLTTNLFPVEKIMPEKLSPSLLECGVRSRNLPFLAAGGLVELQRGGEKQAFSGTRGGINLMVGGTFVVFWRLSLLCDFSSDKKCFCLGCLQWKNLPS